MTHINTLVQNALIAEKTVLINGTSIEIVIELLQIKKLLGKQFQKHTNYSGYVFFTPNSQNPQRIRLTDGTYPDPNLCTFQHALEDAKTYAKLNAFEHYLLHQGYPEEDISEIYPSQITKEGYKEFIEKMRKQGKKPRQTLNHLEKASQRNGVLIGINSKILEKRIEPGKDAEDEVCIYAPNGIEIKYINAIVPLGHIEKQILTQHIYNHD